jgi:hypothetical protein
MRRDLQAFQQSPPVAPKEQSTDFSISAITQGPITWNPKSMREVVHVEQPEPEAAPTVTLIKMYEAKNSSGEPLVNLKAFVVSQLSSGDLPMTFYEPKSLRDATEGSILPGQPFSVYYDFRPKGSRTGPRGRSCRFVHRKLAPQKIWNIERVSHC